MTRTYIINDGLGAQQKRRKRHADVDSVFVLRVGGEAGEEVREEFQQRVIGLGQLLDQAPQLAGI